MKYLVDTNIFIYHFNQDKIATTFLENNSGNYAISFVTFIELLSFPALSEAIAYEIRAFLDTLEVIPTNTQIIENCIQNRKIKKIKLADNIIASTAKSLKMTLVTRNIDDFKSLDIDVLNPF